MPIPIVATLVDKYGNRLDRGGVRVDAKALGAAANTVVEDRKDGTYLITITAGAPGEVKLTVRIDSVELTPTMTVTVVRAGLAEEQAEAEAALAPSGAPEPAAAGVPQESLAAERRSSIRGNMDLRSLAADEAAEAKAAADEAAKAPPPSVEPEAPAESEVKSEAQAGKEEEA